MTRQKIKNHRYFISLNDLQEALLTEQMQSEALQKEEVSTYFGLMLAKIRDCKENHGRKAGRPKKSDNEYTPEEEALMRGNGGLQI